MLKHAMNYVKGGQLNGEYLEFGSSTGVTMTAAFSHAHQFGITAMRFFSFDSFQGLPEISGVDKDGPCEYHQGQYACALDQFKRNLARNGVDLNRVKVVQGWYQDTLTEATQKAIQIQRAAVIWIDCDLYESTVPALNFVTNYVQTGTVICFDDYYCFGGDPQRGEARAFTEWLARNPEIKAIEYRKFEAAGHSFILNVKR